MLLLILVNPLLYIKEPVKKFLIPNREEYKFRFKSINGLSIVIVQDNDNGRNVIPGTSDKDKRFNLMSFYESTRDISQDFKNYWANIDENIKKSYPGAVEAIGDDNVKTSEIYTVTLTF